MHILFYHLNIHSLYVPKIILYFFLNTFNLTLYERNIFLDNIRNVEYIKKQLKKAIELAKEKGYAIAIGHPYEVTFQAIKDSLKELKKVKVVYIDELKTH